MRRPPYAFLYGALLVGLVLACGGLPSAEDPPAEPLSTRLTAHPRGRTAAPNGYLEYLPPGYGDGTPRPLLVFLHGVGENGNGRDQLPWLVANGPPRLIQDGVWPDERDFVVLAPQHHSRGCPTSDEVHRFLSYAVDRYDVDPTRIYLTGLSCGAIGAWAYLGDHQGELVAAAVLIAGNGRDAVREAGCALATVPIWSFHGDADDVVPVSGSVEAMEGLAACDHADRRRLTLYEGVDHDSWTRTYDGTAGHDVYAWLSEQRRRSPR